MLCTTCYVPVVCTLPYGRYLSKVYNNEWLAANSLSPVEDVSVLSKL